MRMRLIPARVWPRLIKRWLPRSLFGRSLLIIVLPIAMMQAAVAWAFFEAHQSAVSRQLAQALAGDVAYAAESWAVDPGAAHLARLTERSQRTQSLSVTFLPGAALPKKPRPSLLPVFDGALRGALRERLDGPFWVDATRYPAYIDIRVQARGGVLRIFAPKERAFAARSHVFILWLTGATLLLTGVAVLFVRQQVRAIERLAAAADAFGRGVDMPRFRPHGAREVRLAAQAFIDMRARIARHIEQRTTLLAAVSHDLRTPLTRLKLQAALADPSPRIDAINADLRDMERMIDDYLAFARGEGGEATQLVPLRALLQEVGAGAGGAAVAVDADPSLAASVRPNAFKRALTNLVTNAAAHGDRVEVGAVRRDGGGVEIRVDDDGPGIAPERYEEAFTPFSRLDEARNPNAKGVGLGLAIARDVARGLGGDLTLHRSPLGGLRAVLRLPG